MSLRALIVCYAFPPTGGAGVGRPLKLAKYLPDFDVSPAVLTAKNPSVPLRDETLLRDISPELEIVRAPTLEPGYSVKQAVWNESAGGKASLLSSIKGRLVGVAKSALQPDAQVLWQPAAARALLGRIARRLDDVVWITAPPFSSFLLAPLARARGLGVVLDYRDEWKTLRETYEMASPMSARVGEFLERRLLRSADAITTATPAFRDALLAAHPFLDPATVHVIPNGFDPDDYPEVLPEPSGEDFVVTYAGTVLAVTNPGGFLDAVRRVHQRAPELAKRLRVRFIGRVVATEEHHFDDAEAIGVERLGYMAKSEIVGELARSHVNLCLLSDHDDCRRIYPGKIFELMHLGRPVLTVAPDGALADLVARHQVGTRFRPNESEAIADHLIDCLERFVAGTYETRAVGSGIEVYHRRHLAGQFASVLRFAAHA